MDADEPAAPRNRLPESEVFRAFQMERDWEEICGRVLIETLRTAGARKIAVYSPKAEPGRELERREYFIATDIGLGQLVVRKETVGHVKGLADWVAWHDVEDPELRTEVFGVADRLTTALRLTIYRPAIQLEDVADFADLQAFALAVLERAGH